MDYTKLITDNANELNDADELLDFINSYADADNSNIKDLEDHISEQADRLVPVYYYDIIKEWQDNTECHEMTVDQIGEYGEKNIYKMMSSDLYFYYEQQIREDYEKLLELIEEAEDEEDQASEDGVR